MKKYGKSILVVDDHEMSVKLLRQILTDSGFDVFSAHSGEQALKLVTIGASKKSGHRPS